MTTILVIAHTPLATALQSCVRHILPDAADELRTLDVDANQSPEEIFAAAKLLSHDADELLVLTDIFGATPANTAGQLVDDGHCRVLAGVNLPMLLRAMHYRHEPLESVVSKATAGGTQGILAVNLTAPQNQAKRSDDPRKNNH